MAYSRLSHHLSAGTENTFRGKSLRTNLVGGYVGLQSRSEGFGEHTNLVILPEVASQVLCRPVYTTPTTRSRPNK